MGHRARVVVSGCFASGVAVLGACNALTGASDLQFDEAAAAVDATPETASPGDVTVAPNDAYVPIDAADAADADADAAPCTPTTTLESVTSSATTFTNGTQIGSVPWVIAPNNAHVSLTLVDVSNYLVGTGLGLDAMLPETAAIQGFTVSVTRSGSDPDEIVDEGIALVRDLVPGPPRTSALSWPEVLTPIQYGSSMDLWAPKLPWTAADVRSANFGVAISARGAEAAMTLARVTTVTVHVYFIRCPGP